MNFQGVRSAVAELLEELAKLEPAINAESFLNIDVQMLTAIEAYYATRGWPIPDGLVAVRRALYEKGELPL